MVSLKNVVKFWVMLALVLAQVGFQPTWAKDEAEPKIPAFSSHLIDTVSWLSSQETIDINKRLDSIRTNGKVQIAVLIIDTTKPFTIEEYSLKVAESWKIGKKGVDNGVLILIAKSDKKVRIEVGYGMEGTIPDIIAKRIISDKMNPFFKENKPYEAIKTVVEQITKRVNGEINDSQEQKKASSNGLTGIEMIDTLPAGAKAIAIVFGIIVGIMFFIENGGVILTGIILPFIGGALALLLYGFAVAIITIISALIIAIALRFGVSIGGAVLSGGGSFGGGGSSGGWD